MAAVAGYFDRKPSSAIRPGPSSVQRDRDPASPQTPQRPLASAFNSPSLSYRAEEDALIFEFGARHISTGFAGESSPRCSYEFGPEQLRRVGDYRHWLPGYERKRRKLSLKCDWGDDHELWRMDMRGFDLGLFEDKVERAVREAHSKYLLQDSRSRRVVVILPSVLPHLLISSILSVFFSNFQNPSITMFPSALLSTVAAGCRSAIVVDIGWLETVMTVIDDYKELAHRRTERAMKRLTFETGRMLRGQAYRNASSTDKEETDSVFNDASFEMCEQLTERLSICGTRRDDSSDNAASIALTLPGQTESRVGTEDTLITVPSPFSSHSTMQVASSGFTETTEMTFFASSQDFQEIDDNEKPLHHLLFQTLLSLPPDVRGTCMSRIIVTGGGSHVPGLKSCLLQHLSKILDSRGWDPVSGKPVKEGRRQLHKVNDNRRREIQPVIDETAQEKQIDFPASQQSQARDEITEKLLRDQSKGSKPSVSGQVRGVETLGAWVGASLLSSLKVKGAVEIERDVFLQQGLAGARRDGEPSGSDGTKAKRQSVGPVAAARAGVVGDRRNWTLGIWA